MPKGKGAARGGPSRPAAAALHEEEAPAEMPTTGALPDGPARQRAGPPQLDEEGVVHQTAAVRGFAPRPFPCLQNKTRSLILTCETNLKLVCS